MRRWWFGLGLLVLLGLLIVAWRPLRTGQSAAVAERALEPVAMVQPKALPTLRSHAIDAGNVAGRVVATFGWGSGEGQLGRERPVEGNPEAPMSLTVDAKGTTWVLDSVNKRLTRVDRAGRLLPSVGLPLQAPQDLALARDGTILVIDRLVDRSIVVLGPDGNLRGELPLLGKGMIEGGAATGIFTVGDSVFVERTHGDSVRVGSTAGVKDVDRPDIPGRPTRDGSAYLTASIVNASAGTVLLTVIDAANRAHRFTRQYSLRGVVQGLMLLDQDSHGVVYVGALVVPADEVHVLCVDSRDGHPLGVTFVPANTSADETFREFAVTDDGEILMLRRTEEAAELRQYSCGGG